MSIITKKRKADEDYDPVSDLYELMMYSNKRGRGRPRKYNKKVKIVENNISKDGLLCLNNILNNNNNYDKDSDIIYIEDIYNNNNSNSNNSDNSNDMVISNFSSKITVNSTILDVKKTLSNIMNTNIHNIIITINGIIYADTDKVMHIDACRNGVGYELKADIIDIPYI